MIKMMLYDLPFNNIMINVVLKLRMQRLNDELWQIRFKFDMNYEIVLGFDEISDQFECKFFHQFKL